MTIDDVANDDILAAGVWGFFGLFSSAKLVLFAAVDPSFATLFSPLVGTIVGAVIGWRHLQNLKAIADAKLAVHREIELAKINACKNTVVTDTEHVE